MEWWAILSILVGTLVVILLMGFPVAFGFLLTDLIFTIYLMGTSGLEVLTLQVYSSLASFVLSPAPMFILMGEFMFHSNLANDTLDCLDRWLHRLPGRLSILAAVSGTIFAATSGSSMANTAMLGTVLVPEMRKRHYSTFMSVGPIIGAGGLAILIPPSALGVIYASIAQISVSGVLMGGVIPGVILGTMFCVFIIGSAVVKPSCAPSYHTNPTPFLEKVALTGKYLVPVGFIIFAVLGMMFLGFATPTEAAALGALATIIVDIVMGRFNYKMLKASLKGTLEVTGMVFMIVAASKTFSSVLAFTNATDGMVAVITGLDVHPIVILLAMQVVVAILGCLMDPVSIMMITLPIFMPIITGLGFDPIWFAVMMMVNLEMGNITPPFGILLFVMQGVTPKDVTFKEIMLAATPYMFFDLLVIAMIIIWPKLALWLPSIVSKQITRGRISSLHGTQRISDSDRRRFTMSKTPEEMYQEREKRVADAIALKTPDRVPFFPLCNLMAVKYTGITPAKAFYDYDAWLEANEKMMLDLEPDIYWPAISAYPGRSFSALQLRQLKWPGGGGAPDSSGIQYSDAEYMKPEEYDRFLEDPTDYFIRCYLPRVFGSLEPLKNLPYLPTLFYAGYRGAMTCAAMASEDYVKAMEALYAAAKESLEYAYKIKQFDERMASFGLPAAFGGASCWAPFDVFGDVHRGMRGMMMDLYRRPEKVLAATEKITPAILQGAIASAKRSNIKRIFIPLHWGADGFMSDEQYKTFYWPGLKKIILGLIDEGLTPCPLFEGEYTSRLKYLTELPKGKIYGMFDRIDMVKAKDMLKDVMCIGGNMPTSVLQYGPAEAVREQTRKLIEAAGKGGGFIMSCRGVLDEADPKMVKVWAEATREYGVY